MQIRKQRLDIGEPEARARQQQIKTQKQQNPADHHCRQVERPPPCHRRTVLTHRDHDRQDADQRATARCRVQAARAGDRGEELEAVGQLALDRRQRDAPMAIQLLAQARQQLSRPA